MQNKEKIKTYALILLTICFVITAPMLFQAKMEDRRQYEAFLNEFYANLDNTLYSIEYFLSEEEKGVTTLASIEHNLETTHLLLRMGDKTVNSHISAQPRFFAGRITQHPNDEGTLTEEQQSELEKVREGLQYMKEGLYSEETGQENKHLSAKEFNAIIEQGASIGAP
ncbi:hypothetical protein [Salisediminibacterium beveridgei]|uniref:Uncharacterized protein n=1 Tax=Salisediminibacterium beveridgei TaxID=632773 RepID=A0A1D7QXY8_9BACI|nr:hypothetical protein [Salisediminibacterium beveridgei]AOM83877.1 hypothetical protein BBEV_2538 [Salisediminibacterium beveridgei]